MAIHHDALKGRSGKMSRYCGLRIVLYPDVLVLGAMAGQTAGAPLIEAGSTWKYLDDGSNRGMAVAHVLVDKPQSQ